MDFMRMQTENAGKRKSYLGLNLFGHLSPQPWPLNTSWAVESSSAPQKPSLAKQVEAS